MEKQYKYDISVIFPSRNEGENVKKVLDELITSLKQIGRTYEVIMLDSPSKAPSISVFKEYASKYPNFTAIDLNQARPAGNDKAVKYMIGFTMAQGKYIFHIDSDGQDNPADMPKFIEKLDEGFDLVVGHKQKRKDGKIYMLTSKISNTMTRKLTGVSVHDMNCGFKGYQNQVAKSLNIKGRWYRFIPAIVAAKGFSVTEVPIENRKREWGTTNFNFRNRLEGGLFDLVNVLVLNFMNETPAYFFGWSAIATFGVSLILFILGFIWDDSFIKFVFIIFSAALFVLAKLIVILSFITEFWRSQIITPIEQYGIKEMFTKTESN